MNSESLTAVLGTLVECKFDEFQSNLNGDSQICRRKVLEEWKNYLNLHGIERAPYGYRKRDGKEPYVWIECPWSIHNSTPGALYTKSNLFFPMELALKIAILGMMP